MLVSQPYDSQPVRVDDARERRHGVGHPRVDGGRGEEDLDDHLHAVAAEPRHDGVDVDYEHFTDGVAVNTFVECIGGLLTQLKKKMPYITTSIAPFEDPVIQKYYQPLWRKYSGVIDYVNFQFYGYVDNTDVPTYVQFYNKQSANYPSGKVLASYMTGNTTGLISPDLGISAAKELQKQNKLPGLFIWSADSSKQSSYGFKYEIQGQQIIANH